VLVGLTLLVGMASVVWVAAMRNVEVLEGDAMRAVTKLRTRAETKRHVSWAVPYSALRVFGQGWRSLHFLPLLTEWEPAYLKTLFR